MSKYVTTKVHQKKDVILKSHESNGIRAVAYANDLAILVPDKQSYEDWYKNG